MLHVAIVLVSIAAIVWISALSKKAKRKHEEQRAQLQGRQEPPTEP